MNHDDATRLGALIQSYLRAKRLDAHKEEEGVGCGKRLDSEFQERLDILGMDGERLLDVPPQRVLGELDRLERQALSEDARVKSAVVSARAREEKLIYGQTQAARPNHRMHAGRHRQPARRGSRR